jgi:hypothetical protein
MEWQQHQAILIWPDDQLLVVAVLLMIAHNP